MKRTGPILWIVVIAFAFVFGIALLARSSLTGHIAAPSIPVTSGTVLSAVAAVVSIGVLLVAGLQRTR